MKIALLHPSFGVVSKPNQPNIKAVADNYGVYPNMSLAYVAGALQQAGHELLFLDAMASNLSLQDMVVKVKEFKSSIMMFSMTTYLYHEMLEVIRFFKRNYNAIVIVGGAHLALFVKETLKNKEIDYGIIGEAEKTVVELLEKLEKKSDLSGVSGIVFRHRGKVVVTKAREKEKDLGSLPFPARNLLPMDKYYSFLTRKKNYAIMITSRGCTFQCIFCEQRTGDIRYRSPENVASEMEECFTRYQVREIDFFDPLFTLDKRRVIKICEEILHKQLTISWSCRSRVDTVDVEMLKMMKKAGCIRIYYGIESGDESILKAIQKNTSLLKIRETIAATKRSGIEAFGYFMFGCPGETSKTIDNTIKLALELPLDYAQFNRLSVLPGTKLYNRVAKETGDDPWARFIASEGSEKPIPRPNCNLSDEDLDKYIRRAYRKFYFRPKVILRASIKLITFNSFFRYVKAAYGMMKNQ